MEPFGQQPLSLPQIARVAEIEYRTLHTWLKRGLFGPSVRVSSGAGTPNLFSWQDALVARILADLRRAGLELDTLKLAATGLRRHRKRLSGEEILVLNGRVALFDGMQRLGEALNRPEPALVYRVAWARDALIARARDN